MTSSTIIFQSFTKKELLQAFLDTKSLRIISTSMLHIPKSFNLSCNIVVLKQFLNSFNFDKLLSAKATVTSTPSIVRRIRYTIEIFG